MPCFEFARKCANRLFSRIGRKAERSCVEYETLASENGYEEVICNSALGEKSIISAERVEENGVVEEDAARLGGLFVLQEEEEAELVASRHLQGQQQQQERRGNDRMSSEDDDASLRNSIGDRAASNISFRTNDYDMIEEMRYVPIAQRLLERQVLRRAYSAGDILLKEEKKTSFSWFMGREEMRRQQLNGRRCVSEEEIKKVLFVTGLDDIFMKSWSSSSSLHSQEDSSDDSEEQVDEEGADDSDSLYY